MSVCLYTISVASEILATHTRTLMMYENLGRIAPSRTPTRHILQLLKILQQAGVGT